MSDNIMFGMYVAFSLKKQLRKIEPKKIKR